MQLDKKNMSSQQQFYWLLTQTERDIQTPKELTKREASRILDQLNAEKETP